MCGISCSRSIGGCTVNGRCLSRVRLWDKKRIERKRKTTIMIMIIIIAAAGGSMMKDRQVLNSIDSILHTSSGYT